MVNLFHGGKIRGKSNTNFTCVKYISHLVAGNSIVPGFDIVTSRICFPDPS